MPSNKPPQEHPSLIPIAQAVIAARKRRRWSRTRLALEAAVDYRTALNVEHGRKVNLSVLISILEALGLEISIKSKAP